MQKKIANFFRGGDTKDLLIHSFIAIIIRVGGSGSTFLMNIVIARFLGADDSGYFFLGVTIVTVMAVVGRIGADNVVLKYVSIYNEKKEWGKMNAVLELLVKKSIVITICISLLICIFSKYIAIYFFQKPQFIWPLFWSSISIPFVAVYNILAMALQAKRKTILSVTLLKITSPVILMVLLLCFKTSDSQSTCILFLISNVFTTGVAIYWWKKNSILEKASYDFKELWKVCMPLWIVAIMQQLSAWGGQFISGIFNSPTELAQLAVGRNTSLLITFILTAVNFASAPRFASLYNQGDLNSLKKYARKTSQFMALISTPIILIIWIFPRDILSLFGKDFIEGEWILRILATGQYINVISGSVGYLLMMSGHEKDMRNITIINGFSAVILALILNPIFGAVGSALGTAIAVASANLLGVRMVKKRLGFTSIGIWD